MKGTAIVIGGDAWKHVLQHIAKAQKGLRVGILEGSTTSEGNSIAQYAAVQEYGGTMTIPTRKQHLKFIPSKKRPGVEVFAKASRKRGITKEMDVTINQYVVNVPARAFLRTAVHRYSGQWGGKLARLLQGHCEKPDAIEAALDMLGLIMEKDVQALINDESLPPPLRPSTIASKASRGSPEPEHALVDTGQMMRAIAHDIVSTGGSK